MNERSQIIEQLRWKKFPVLNDGFVCLVDVMGDDAAVTQAARVSFGNDKRGMMPDEWLQIERALGDWVGTQEERDRACERQLEIEREVEKERESDRTLLRYLMRHRHTTPFEMAEVKILVRVPMDCWRQWIRHRTANVNEYSTRYTEAIDSQQKTDPTEWRLQATNNKQGSSGFLEAHSSEAGVIDGVCLTSDENSLHRLSDQIYQRRLKAGVAKEQARKDLPLSTYTEAYWKCDLHNILGFLSLRMDSHAQKEIRDYATIIGEQIIKPLFPLVWEAFEDYRLGGMFLSRLDNLVINAMAGNKDDDWPQIPWQESYNELNDILGEVFSNKREREECVAKLKRLGLVE